MPDALDKMFQCGPEANFWLRLIVTEGMPRAVLEQWHDKLAFISTFGRDGFRINRALRESRELIFLSERILPSTGMDENDPIVRYFMFACLHESVHAIKQHKPPNEISTSENEAQEREADELAFQWFNRYVRDRGNEAIPLLTRDEVDKAQARNQEIMKRQL